MMQKLWNEVPKQILHLLTSIENLIEHGDEKKCGKGSRNKGGEGDVGCRGSHSFFICSSIGGSANTDKYK